MGFYKRFINKENLAIQYKTGGLEYVKRYFSADALIISDDESSDILDLLNENKDSEAEELLKILINKEDKDERNREGVI
tara:strand:- start:4903 stop:5139 length:237 start_codon:yes stop_codon:yes gene_type:complete